jgi:hypothetical protein
VRKGIEQEKGRLGGASSNNNRVDGVVNHHLKM